MNFFDKISAIKEWVDEYNAAHLLSNNPDTAGKVKFTMFNSSDMVDRCNADCEKKDWITEEEMGLRPNTDYYEMDVYLFRKCTEEEMENAKANELALGEDIDEEYYSKPHYILEFRKRYLSSDITYFFRKMKKFFNKV